MNLNEVLILVNEKNYNTKMAEQLNNVDIAYTYKKRTGHIEKRLYDLSLLLNSSFFYKFIGFSNIDLKKYTTIILYECNYPDKLIYYIRKKNNNVRIIYWLWNTIGKSGYNSKKYFLNLLDKRNNPKYKFDIYSFDKKDCLQYNLKYNNQVSYKINISTPQKIKYDFIFCGRDKNRFCIIKDLINKLKDKKFKILLSPDKNKKYDSSDYKYFINTPISYDELITYVNQSKCIIDIVQENQNGLTWRPLESMFYKKKLITNFKQITSYDFYNKHNIFILGIDNIEHINYFLKTPYHDINKKIIYNYLPQGWLNNFLISKG